MLTFKQGTKLYLTDGANLYEFLVSSASASQSFQETTQKVKTIHNPHLLSNSFVTEKTPVGVDFTMYLTPSHGGFIAEWFGFVENSGKYEIPYFGITPNVWDLYIKSGDTIYKVDKVVGENISFMIDRKQLVSLDITAVGSDLQEVSSIPSIESAIAQSSQDFYNAPITISDSDGGFDRVLGVTLELTRSIIELDKKSIHDVVSNNIYKVSEFALDTQSVSGSITQLKVDDSNNYKALTDITINYGSSLEIFLPDCNTTDRWELGNNIHTKTTDYKLLPENTQVKPYIQF